MKVLHIAQNSFNGYEKVELVANRHSLNNHLHVIKHKDGEITMTGGFIINDTPEIRDVLDNIPKDQQYDFVKAFKCDPFVKSYYI